MSNNQDMSKSSELSNTRSADLNMVTRAFNARSRALARINRCRKNQLLTIGDRVFIKDHSIRNWIQEFKKSRMG